MAGISVDSPNSSELELEFLDFLLIQGKKKELKPNSPNVSIEWIETGQKPRGLEFTASKSKDHPQRDEPSVELFEERTTDFWRVISPYGNIHHIVWLIIGCRIVFGIFVCLRFWIFVGFLSRYHLPCICNSLELEPVILHGICYILAWSLCILHGICYIWPCLPSILHGICHILAFQPLICMVFATFWYFKRSCGSLEGSLGFHLGCHLRFPLGFHLRFYLGLHLGFYLGFQLGFL